jgi:DNA repair protein RecO (recombination protein O)
LLSDWTEENDPHPSLFDAALETLHALGAPETATGPRLARFELVLLHELGYRPALDECAACGAALDGKALAFSPPAGGALCRACQPRERDRRPLSEGAWLALRRLGESAEAAAAPYSAEVRAEVRQVLNHYVTWSMGRRPRLLPYLGS